MIGKTYVLIHPSLESIKVGYTSTADKRIERFIRRGWEIYRALHFASPALARDVEQATLFQLRHRLHVPQHLPSVALGRALGSTETSSARLVSPEQVWEIVCEEAGRILLSPSLTKPDGRRFNGGTPPRRVPGDTQPYSPIAKKQASLEQASAAASEEQK